MTGRAAVLALLAAANREELIAADLVARAVGQSKRRVLRDWRRRQQPETHVGREILFASSLVLKVYFPHVSPAVRDHT